MYTHKCSWCKRNYNAKRTTSRFCGVNCRKQSFMFQGGITDGGKGKSKDGSTYVLIFGMPAWFAWGEVKDNEGGVK